MGLHRAFRRITTLVGAGLVVVALGSACGADETAVPTAPAVTTVAASGAAKLVGPDEFAARVDQPEVVTINVHVPDEGSIAGTDLVIPFLQIDESTALPADKDTPLAVYCRSGNMSAGAVEDLASLGFTDIVELDGGFDAWAAAGRPLHGAS